MYFPDDVESRIKSDKRNLIDLRKKCRFTFLYLNYRKIFDLSIGR